MSFIDKLKSVFIVPENNPDQSNRESLDKPQGPVQVNSPESQKSINIELESSDKFSTILAQVMDANNQAGFDYLEYKKAVQSIAKMQNLEEAAQYKTAYAAAMSMNVQPGQLIDSARRYLMVLETELTKFNQTAGQFLQTQTGNKEKESQDLKRLISQKQDQVQQLQQELERHQKRMLELESELKAIKTKVETNKASFKLSFEQLVGEIRSDIQKMEQYLK